ncbi:serine protease gd-like [Episyrphus balteatus]|uniref:serine protease gd-like n=1 Tax=Episyrphus balteatus TaxID=286459 RepID=UPI0024862959|nr:serine protease gd-like [Episyrphus balteatus]
MITRFNVVTSVILLTTYLCKCATAQNNQLPNIPCPDVFQYVRSGNEVIGLITVNNVQYGETTIQVEMSQPGAYNTNNAGKLSLNFNKNKVFEYISAGRPFTYRVDFPLPNVTPRVTSITVNGVNLCSGPGYNSPSTTMTLEHTLNAFSSNSYSPVQFIPNTENQRPISRPNMDQGPNINSNNMPEYLKFSPSLAQQMSVYPSYREWFSNQQSSNQPSNIPSSSYNQPSYNPSPRNQPSQNSPTSYNQPSYFPPMNEPSYTSPSSPNKTIFTPSPPNQPSYNPPPSSNHPFFNPSPRNQPSYNSQQQSSNPPFVNPSPQNQPSYNSPPSPPNSYSLHYNRPSYRQHGIDQQTLNQPSFLQYTFPSYDQPELDKPKPSPGQIQYKSNDHTNPSLTSNQQSPPRPDTTTQQPIFTTSTEINKPTPPPLDIDPRLIEPTSTLPPVKPIDTATFEYINSICGRENLNIDMKKLNVKGQIVSKARFPWIVAVFKRKDDDLKFQCGGSLISTRTVVSAAHCFYAGLEPIRPEDILVSMGRHNLTDWLDAFNIDVERIIEHPDYRPTLQNFDADLAIVRLKERVTFTTSVRPICMWQGVIDARELEGVSGAIVGWGSDGIRNTTIVPTLVNATIVSELTCIRSNDQFISATSNRTLCAGNLDGSGPCLGDSGNGLMIRNRNKWMLRGTVSATIGSPTRPCILDQYAIFSDIAMFIEWIQSNMLL